MSFVSVAIGAVAVGAAGSYYQGQQAGKAADKAAKGALGAAAQSQALNEQRYGQAQYALSPFIGSEFEARNQLLGEMGLGQQVRSMMGPPPIKPEKPVLDLRIDRGHKARRKAQGNYERELSQWNVKMDHYNEQLSEWEAGKAEEAQQAEEATAAFQSGQSFQDAPGYQEALRAVDESMIGIDALGQEQLRSVNQGAAGAGSLYSGRRGQALADVGAQTQLDRSGLMLKGAGIQQSYYNNYMNMLQSMASPTTTQNVANLGMNQAANIGQQNIAAQQQASNFQLQGQQAQGAAMADIMGAGANLGAAYLGRPQTPSPLGSGGGMGAPMGSGQQYGAYA